MHDRIRNLSCSGWHPAGGLRASACREAPPAAGRRFDGRDGAVIPPDSKQPVADAARQLTSPLVQLIAYGVETQQHLEHLYRSLPACLSCSSTSSSSVVSLPIEKPSMFMSHFPGPLSGQKGQIPEEAQGETRETRQNRAPCQHECSLRSKDCVMCVCLTISTYIRAKLAWTRPADSHTPRLLLDLLTSWTYSRERHPSLGSPLTAPGPAGHQRGHQTGGRSLLFSAAPPARLCPCTTRDLIDPSTPRPGSDNIARSTSFLSSASPRPEPWRVRVCAFVCAHPLDDDRPLP